MPFLDLIQMSALYDTGNILHSTLELDEVLQHAAALGQRIMRAKRCAVFVFETANVKRETSNVNSDHFWNELEAALSPHLDAMRGSGQLTRLTSLDADSRWGAYAVSELLLAPLKVGGAMVGALYVDQPPDALQWTEGDVNLLEAYGEQVALAVRNAMSNRFAQGLPAFIALVIRMPMTMILGFVEMLTEDTELNDEQRRNVEGISAAARNLEVYINTLGVKEPGGTDPK